MLCRWGFFPIRSIPGWRGLLIGQLVGRPFKLYFFFFVWRLSSSRFPLFFFPSIVFFSFLFFSLFVPFVLFCCLVFIRSSCLLCFVAFPFRALRTNYLLSYPSLAMPYNTRRKSLSLPSLGIHVPNSSRRSPALSKPTHNNPADPQLPSSKRVKRSHEPSSQSPEPQSSGLKAESNAARPDKRNIYHHTPPPSPVNGEIPHKIDTDGINDDVVVAVIEQLEKTGNRPHLVKELAAVLVTFNDNVAKYVTVLV